MSITVLGHHSVVRIETTIKTTHEADAVIEAIRIMRGTLTSHREGLAADLGIDDTEPSFAEMLASALG